MTGVELARALALLGAETVVAAPKDAMPFGDAGPAAHADRWREIGRRMREHERGDDAALARLRDGFGLTPVEYWLVMLCAAAERHPEAAVAFGMLMDEARAHLPTPSSVAQLLHAARDVAPEEALAAAVGGGAPARFGLIDAEAAPGRALAHQTLRLTQAEFHALFASAPAPFRTRAPAEVRAAACAFEESLVRRAVAALDGARVLCLRGAAPRALRQFAHDMAASLGLDVRLFPVGDAAPGLPVLMRVRDGLPVLDATAVTASAAVRTMLTEAAASMRRLVVLAGDGLGGAGLAAFTVPRLGWAESERVWLAATGNEELARRLAARFRVDASEAVAAWRNASAVKDAEDVTLERLVAREVLEEGGARIGRLVTHLRSDARLADLVASPSMREQLADIVGWQRSSPRVFGDMGLGRRTPLGRALTCLFSGPPGTGKTFAAQCLANELDLNLYRIDLSQVVSKYIGETEKALSSVFDEAEAGHGVLLFDEADALFGKRSEVKDAHDRYANIEVGYLLQRIESYEGVVVLATNLRSNIDAAFLRRIRFLVEFPMPDAPMRRRLWEQALPDRRHLEDDLPLEAFVGRFRLSGGSISNIGLAAAHAAAAGDGRISARHLARATYRELEKSGQTRDRESFGPLAEHLSAEVA